ncbi:probable G-protein coupled receptor 139 [Chiloscyllium plagiosum]|uniref:probable G-protein coupled receptor 139 n=1 Tax=Chiloscyllium plagiosum TaxID=36176 RepID=UPI001CB7B520|nr:probable G-protein coupled receptor 139 [Chiloscyllium plagiosum]
MENELFISNFLSLFLLLNYAVNLLAIVILSQGKCGLSVCISRYLVAMATADLLVVINEVVLYRISYYYFRGSFLDMTPVCSIIIVFSHISTNTSVWFTVTFTFDRFVAICSQKLKRKYCTEKTAVVVITTTSLLFGLKSLPFYFTLQHGEIIDNVPWDCFTKENYFTDLGWVIFDWFDSVLTPLLPFALILLLNVLTIRHILVSSRVRKGLRGQSKGGYHTDPEMVSRRKSVILLFAVSGSFTLLWLTTVAEFLYYNITEANFADYTDSLIIFEQVGYMLQILSSCTNTFIYGVTNTKFREQFRTMLKYPGKLITKLIK